MEQWSLGFGFCHDQDVSGKSNAIMKPSFHKDVTLLFIAHRQKVSAIHGLLLILFFLEADPRGETACVFFSGGNGDP